MPATDTDQQLLERVQTSDVEAFKMLFERYQPTVFRNALFRTGLTDLAHDIVQETFLRVWEHRGSLKPELSFLAYALRISGNLMRDVARHRKTRRIVESDLPPSPPSEGDNPEDMLQRDMVADRLNDIVNTKLPEKCRTVFLLSRFEGKTHKEIAELLHLSVRTVENQISSALKVIRKDLRGFVEE